MQELNCDENMQGQFLRFLRTLKGTYLFNQGLLLAGPGRFVLANINNHLTTATDPFTTSP
jgi:hypothetical protein